MLVINLFIPSILLTERFASWKKNLKQTFRLTSVKSYRAGYLYIRSNPKHGYKQSVGLRISLEDGWFD